MVGCLNCSEYFDGCTQHRCWPPSQDCLCGCRKRRKAERKATPLPWSKLIVLCAVLFVNQFGMNMLFPFLPFMVHDFFPYLDTTELGHKAGYIGSAYFMGNFTGSLIWGLLSDKIGRRPVLLFGVCATLICELLFGFSQNFTWAIIARFLWGLLNGNVGVVKTYISEICDDTNQATGFAAIGTTGGIGRLMGSAAGGFLARPASQYKAMQLGFFCDNPYCLPCIVGAVISLFSLISAWLFLDETLVKNKAKKTSSATNTSVEPNSCDDSSENSSDTPISNDSGIELVQSKTTDTGVDFGLDAESVRFSSIKDTDDDTEDDRASLVMSESDLNTDSEYEVSSDVELLRNARLRKWVNKKHKERCFRTISKLTRKVLQRLSECVSAFYTCAMCLCMFDYSKFRTDNLRKVVTNKGQSLCYGLLSTFMLMRDRKVFLSVSLYGIIAFLGIITTEVIPLLLVNSYEFGGYSMDPSALGVILMVSAIVQLFFQFLVYPRIVKCFGYRHTFKLGVALFSIACILLPLSNRISGPVSESFPDTFMESGSGLDNSSDIDFCGNLIDSSANTSSGVLNSPSVIPARVWAVIISLNTVIIVSRLVSITSVMVLISNSCLPENRGRVNGFGQSLAALGRMVGPITGAPLFAWTTTTGTRWPLNFHFVFDLLAVGSVGLILFSFFLPRSIEKKKDSIESNFQTNDIEPTTIAEDTSEHGSAGTDVSEEERDS